jgi:hypothetical protein
MNRRVATLGLTVLAACFSVAWCVPIDRAAEEKAEAGEALTPKKLIALLQKRIPEISIDPGTAFGEALEILAAKSGLPLHIDEQAFQSLDPAFKILEQPVKLSTLKGVRASTALGMLLSQIRMEKGYGAAYLVRGETIEVTTTYHALAELVGTEIPAGENNAGADDKDEALPLELRAAGSSRRLSLPIVHMDFHQKSLRDLLAELAESTGQTIVLDPRVGDKAKTPITATFANAFLDTVIELAVDGADLTVVRVDGTFYVTTPENAEKVLLRRPAHNNQGKPAKLDIGSPAQ